MWPRLGALARNFEQPEICLAGVTPKSCAQPYNGRPSIDCHTNYPLIWQAYPLLSKYELISARRHPLPAKTSPIASTSIVLLPFHRFLYLPAAH
jgi:hypothetical protein